MPRRSAPRNDNRGSKHWDTACRDQCEDWSHNDNARSLSGQSLRHGKAMTPPFTQGRQAGGAEPLPYGKSIRINTSSALLRYAADTAEVPRAKAVVYRAGHAVTELVGLAAAVKRDDAAAVQQ